MRIIIEGSELDRFKNDEDVLRYCLKCNCKSFSALTARLHFACWDNARSVWYAQYEPNDLWLQYDEYFPQKYQLDLTSDFEEATGNESIFDLKGIIQNFGEDYGLNSSINNWRFETNI